MDYTLLAQLTINGVLLGLIYGLVGLGLSLILGVMGILNIAHGALYMIAGFMAYLISTENGLPPILGLVILELGVP